MPHCQGNIPFIQEVKALKKPEFAANPEKYYPTDTFYKFGFSRAQCKCGNNYWRKSDKVNDCGDSKYILLYSVVVDNTHLLVKDVDLDSKRESLIVKLGTLSKELLLKHVFLALKSTATR